MKLTEKEVIAAQRLLATLIVSISEDSNVELVLLALDDFLKQLKDWYFK